MLLPFLLGVLLLIGLPVVATLRVLRSAKRKTRIVGEKTRVSVVVRLMLHISSPPGTLWVPGFVAPAEAFRPASGRCAAWV